MKSKLKRCITAMAAFAALASIGVSSAAAAGAPYESYNYDRWGDAIPSQAGYLPDRTISGIDLGVGALESPGDIFFDSSGLLYIADTGNTVYDMHDETHHFSVHLQEAN